MNKDLLKLFNNGDNNGSVELIADDNIVIKCHDFVFKSQCGFINDNNHIKLMYSSRIIILAVSKMYTNEFVFGDLDINEIIQLILLMDELRINDRNKIVLELDKQFETKLTEKNWARLFNTVYLQKPLHILQETITNYFIHNVLKNNYSKFPLVWDINPDAEKYLLEIFSNLASKKFTPNTISDYLLSMCDYVESINSETTTTEINKATINKLIPIPEYTDSDPKNLDIKYKLFLLKIMALQTLLENTREALIEKIINKKR